MNIKQSYTPSAYLQEKKTTADFDSLSFLPLFQQVSRRSLMIMSELLCVWKKIYSAVPLFLCYNAASFNVYVFVSLTFSVNVIRPRFFYGYSTHEGNALFTRRMTSPAEGWPIVVWKKNICLSPSAPTNARITAQSFCHRQRGVISGLMRAAID